MEGKDKLLQSRARDCADMAERYSDLRSMGFLDPHEAIVARRGVYAASDIRCELFGGYDEAERCMLLCYPEYLKPELDDVISVLKISGRDIGGLSHKDFLGSLMGLGIKRENIGDIVPLEDVCYVFIKPGISDWVVNNLTKVGRCGVKVTAAKISDVTVPPKKTKPIRASVSSLRLDSVLSAAVGVSRGKAAELIRADAVKLNFEPAESVSKMLKTGDILSVRHYGRFVLSEIGGLTRKGRQSVTIEKYV